MAGFTGRHPNVYVYFPNLIGYARIACALYAFSVAFVSPVACVFWYFLGFVCDELDGRVARMLNQTSTLGAVLDMVTDRVATSGLLVVLCMMYQRWHTAFLSLLMLDIFSHWFHMYSTLLAGSTTHKDIKSRSWLVRTYYKHRLFMGFCCICCEVLYLAMYMLQWPEFQAWMPVALPAWPQARAALQPLIPYLAAVPGLQWLSSSTATKGVPLLLLIELATLPGFYVKQFCNVVQLKNALQTLVEHDQHKLV